MFLIRRLEIHLSGVEAWEGPSAADPRWPP